MVGSSSRQMRTRRDGSDVKLSWRSDAVMESSWTPRLWDYTCFYCGGRGSPDQNTTGRGHSKDCPVYGRRMVSDGSE